MNEAFIIEPDTRVTYINQQTNEKWNNWKLYKECTKQEKEQINLAAYPKNTILFDRDLPGKSSKEIEHDYEKFKLMLIKRKITCFYSYRSPKGFHIIAPFKLLDKLKPELKREVKKYYVSMFQTDPAKISDRGVVSLPGKSHFKNSVIYDIFEWNKGENEIHESVLVSAKKTVIEYEKNLSKINKDKDFENYFEKDPFFLYIKNNIIPDDTNRDMSIFPNLAVASFKSGKNKLEIKQIIEPIIKKNFPGKNYAEFDGWLKKAFSNTIKDYNPFQLNTWMTINSKDKKEIYDLTPITVEQLEDKKDTKEKFLFYWDKDLENVKNKKTEWLIEKWIPKGDICFIAGKAASFKTTLSIHFGYAISEGHLAFNKYNTIKSKVLYLNEENSSNILLNMVSRVKKGLDINSKSSNICFSILENIKLDIKEDLEYLINFINKNKIEVLFCDSLRRFISFDENSATEMNKLFNNLKIVRKQCNNLTIIILHHLKKDSQNYQQDSKDMLRGSSDIVNSADSIIGIKRKHGVNAINIEHIKNRSGEEVTNKLILINTGDDKNKAYFYESDKEMDKTKMVSAPENCAEKIVEYLREKKLKTFRKNDLKINFPYDTLTKALKMLILEGTLTSFGSTKNRQFSFIDVETIQKVIDTNDSN